MSSKLRILAALSTLVLAGACGSQSAQDETDTRQLSQELLDQPVGDGNSTPVAADQSLADAGPRVPVSQVGINRGSVEAPVKVVELSDYGCGYCRQFHQETFPTLVSDFIETGMVEWKFVPFVTGMFDNSVVATEAAECVYAQSEDAFETLNARLWDEQRAWKSSGEPADVVRSWVDELGVDVEAYDACMANDEQLARVASATSLAQQLGVRGTPTFVVVGYPPLQGALPLDMFQQVLTAVHAEVTGQGAPSGDDDGRENDAPGGSQDEGDAGS